jgi:hypothetical protein
VFTLFAPGIERAYAGGLNLPALGRLLARGRARPLPETPWAALAMLAGGDLERWPVGPVSALGELSAPMRACLRVEPLGGEFECEGIFRLSAADLQISRDEAEALAVAFGEVFAQDGVRLEVAAPERWYLAWDEAHAPARSWTGFPAPVRSLARDERPAPPEPDLRLLLSEIEMLFHAHPVNAARRERGAPIIAGMHPWGGGTLGEGAASPPRAGAAREEPYLAGLRRLGVVPGDAMREFVRGATPGDGFAWPLAVEEGVPFEQLQMLDRAWGAPLLAGLRRGRLAGVRIVTGEAVHETSRLDVLRFWRRPPPAAEAG